MKLIDLEYQSTQQLICCCALETREGFILVDPGPASTLLALGRNLKSWGASFKDVHSILLTHIHLDHAGATGSIVRSNSRIRVFVHELGARHMANPSRLVASAQRLYGEAMPTLWGEICPVPEENLTALSGGEHLTLGNFKFGVAYTPGHAPHHVSFFDPQGGVAFVGDTAGIRIAGSTTILPPTPPPDIDLESWAESMKKILSWSPQQLVLSHFGLVSEPEDHFTRLQSTLREWGFKVQQSLLNESSDEERARDFAGAISRQLRAQLPDPTAAAYQGRSGAELSWYGLARYWRKRQNA